MSLCPLRNENINVLLVVLREIVKNQGSSTFGASLEGRHYFEMLKSG